MHLFSSFSANTLLVQYVHNVLHFSLSVPVLVFFFFCTVLQLFALVFCFGDQVLSSGSSLATDFLGVVPLWRVAQRKFFQPWEGGSGVGAKLNRLRLEANYELMI